MVEVVGVTSMRITCRPGWYLCSEKALITQCCSNRSNWFISKTV